MKKTTIASIVLVGAIAGGVIYYQNATRPTRVKAVFEPAAAMTGLTVSIAGPGPDIVPGVKADYESAAEPLRRAIQENKDALARIQDTLKQIEDEEVRLEMKIADTKTKFTTKVQDTWDAENKRLEDENAAKRQEFNNSIRQKAASLGIEYQPNEEVQSPEAWISAFRLGLYNAPTNVNAQAERQWSEQQLEGWRAYQKEWQSRLNAAMVKGRAIDEKKNSEVAELEAQIPRTRRRREPLLMQQERLTAELAALEQQFQALPMGDYFNRIRSLHKARALITANVDAEGRAVFDDVQLQPGRYFLLAEKVTDDGTLLWYREFDLQPRRDNVVNLTLQEAKTVEKMLETAP